MLPNLQKLTDQLIFCGANQAEICGSGRWRQETDTVNSLFKYCHNPWEWNIFILLKRPKYALNCRSLICLSDGLFINHVWSIWDWLWGLSWRWGQCCSGTPTSALPSCRKPRSRTMNPSPDEQTSLLKGWKHPWGDSPQMGSYFSAGLTPGLLFSMCINSDCRENRVNEWKNVEVSGEEVWKLSQVDKEFMQSLYLNMHYLKGCRSCFQKLTGPTALDKCSVTHPNRSKPAWWLSQW